MEVSRHMCEVRKFNERNVRMEKTGCGEIVKSWKKYIDDQWEENRNQ